MNYIIFVFVRAVYFLVTALQTMMFFRAILSWLPFDEESTLNRFLYTVTEPVILPIRKILERFKLFQGSPFDISFFIAFFVLVFLQIILEVCEASILI